MKQSQDQFEAPVLLIIFNRIDTTKQIFNEIRKQKPKYLYIASDGPRENVPGEVERCRQTQEIVKDVDWDCELKTWFREKNSGGAAVGVSSAISWFFDNVDEGIVFEHDVLPHPDFFKYCSELLKKYRNEPRVSIISGVNFTDNIGEDSYYFAPTGSNWGFATWKRFWQHYDLFLDNYPLSQVKRDMKFYNFKWRQRCIRLDIYHRLRQRKLDDWAYSVHFIMHKLHGLCIAPTVNLITNIGGGEKALNLKSGNDPRLNRKIFPIIPIKHPSKIERNIKLEEISSRIWGNKVFIVSRLLKKTIAVNISNPVMATLWFSWRWFRRTFLEKRKYNKF